MTTFRHFAVRLLLVSRLLGSGNPFGPRLETLHNPSATNQVRGDFVTKASKSSSEDQHNNSEADVNSSFELRLFTFPPAAFARLDQVPLSCRACEAFDSLQEQAAVLASETFEESLIVDDFCGEDCDECEIPEDWKVLSGPVAANDVMAFLGITRAKPLSIATLSIRTWE